MEVSDRHALIRTPTHSFVVFVIVRAGRVEGETEPVIGIQQVPYHELQRVFNGVHFDVNAQ